MLLFKKSVAIICLITFLISTIGISIQKHSCNMSETTKVILFPELFGSTSQCFADSCCDEEYVSCSLNNVPCCNNTFTYAKIDAIYSGTIASINLVKHILDIPVILALQTSINEVDSKTFFIDYIPPPIKLFGTSLLHFIHNIKIALPFSL